MVECTECGETIVQGSDYCGNCGAEATTAGDSAQESFIQRYGAAPLPLASERGEMINLYAKLLSSIPIVGGIAKFFSRVSFWCYSLWLTVFTVITGGADVTKRFEADFNYLKDNFNTGYDGSQRPPEPPQ